MQTYMYLVDVCLEYMMAELNCLVRTEWRIHPGQFESQERMAVSEKIHS